MIFEGYISVVKGQPTETRLVIQDNISLTSPFKLHSEMNIQPEISEVELRPSRTSGYTTVTGGSGSGSKTALRVVSRGRRSRGF